MAQKLSKTRRRSIPAEPRSTPPPAPNDSIRTGWTPLRLGLVVLVLLAGHWALAVRSLVSENPTVDEVVHLPAGISYWQNATFKLYAHNPPLIKLFAALPVLGAGPDTATLYSEPMWGWTSANKAAFAHGFSFLNAERYFDLFTTARLWMPWFSVLGGLLVFEWSRRLYGPWGGLLSLSLWVLCPNILAHTRLITTDVGATVLGFGATYLFWRYLRKPSWAWATAAGVGLGLAQLAKFSNLLLVGLWPILWLIHEVLRQPSEGRPRRVLRALGQGAWMLALTALLINVGYGFERVGHPLGTFRFTCQTLTVPRERPLIFNPRPDDPLRRIQEYHVNRFAGTPLASLPTPLPYYYVMGFDEQKLEAEGIPTRFLVQPEIGDAMGPEGDEVTGYPVFLNGELQAESWWYYYWLALLYKVPEGTWALVLLSIAVLLAVRRARAEWADELTLWLVPLVVLLVMSFGTNIAIGLRYVLPIFPYVFVSVGKLAPWAFSLLPRWRKLAFALIGLSVGSTALATALIHPHYLAYFNWLSGGPARGSEHLIDSNLDWGQDLVNLHRWLKEHAPAERVGIAYFGQIPPTIFEAQGDPLDWFLPPARPGTLGERPDLEVRPLSPGLYAVSASLLRGLPWRVYAPDRWAPYSASARAFSYFEELTPLDQEGIGYSIFVYRVSEEDARRLSHIWNVGG